MQLLVTNLPPDASEGTPCRIRFYIYVFMCRATGDVRRIFSDAGFGDIQVSNLSSNCGSNASRFGKEQKEATVTMRYFGAGERAITLVDGRRFKDRELRVHRMTTGSSVLVKQLGPFVTNQMLVEAFDKFGDVERAVVKTDGKGQGTGVGHVFFKERSRAKKCVDECQAGLFILNCSPRPTSH